MAFFEMKSLIQKNDALICIARLRPWQKCLEFTKPMSSDINKRESRHTIKDKDFLLTYLIAFVELYIKTHRYNFLMNIRRIVIVNVVKII
jgi:hypothetical protein